MFKRIQLWKEAVRAAVRDGVAQKTLQSDVESDRNDSLVTHKEKSAPLSRHERRKNASIARKTKRQTI